MSPIERKSIFCHFLLAIWLTAALLCFVCMLATADPFYLWALLASFGAFIATGFAMIWLDLG